ncbi:hypothetical protein C0989_004924 [Termitomyces sp. Mn162]|nr:hypothetical protein C0989_004924 [Termitomyces sp. Mn162]
MPLLPPRQIQKWEQAGLHQGHDGPDESDSSTEAESSSPQLYHYLPDIKAISLESPTSSIFCLPDKVLGLIFVNTLDPLVRQWYFAPAVDRPPMVLTHVCKWWRRVAISLPMLWSFNAYLGLVHSQIALYRLFLNRGRGMAPLIITFDGSYSTELDAAQDLFFSHIHLWADVKISLGPSICCKLAVLHPGDALLLKKVHIDSNNTRVAQSDVYQLITFLALSPNLSALSWDRDIPTMFYSVQWQNVTRFSTATRLHTGECWALLSCFTQIEEIIFSNYVCSPIRMYTRSILVDKTLRSLSIRGSNPVEFLDTVTLTCLNALRLSAPDDIYSIQRLVERSGCTLRHLIVEGVVDDDRDLLGFLGLECFDSIHSLRFTQPGDFNDKTAGLLTWHRSGDSPTKLFPLLSVLEFEECHTTDGVFSRMILSRWRGSESELKCVRLTKGCLRNKPVDEACLSSLIKDDIQFVWKSAAW